MTVCRVKRLDNNVIEPLRMSDLPDSPWSEITMDFCGPVQSGEYLMVVIDEYSRYPEVELINSTSSQTVIRHLDAIFSRHGIPSVLKTDNGPPFQSTDFAQYCSAMNCAHRRISPLWPRANGECERFMRTLKKMLQTATVLTGNWKQQLYTFLRHYRATPHTTTGISPAELLFGRKLRTELPVINRPSDQHMDVRDRDHMKKEKMKSVADKRNRARMSNFSIGDSVLVKQR